MFGLFMTIGFVGIGAIVKDPMYIMVGAIFYIGWQLCVLGSTISNKKKADDLPSKCGNIILEPIEVDAINRGVIVCRDMSDGSRIYIRKEREGDELDGGQ